MMLCNVQVDVVLDARSSRVRWLDREVTIGLSLRFQLRTLGRDWHPWRCVLLILRIIYFLTGLFVCHCVIELLLKPLKHSLSIRSRSNCDLAPSRLIVLTPSSTVLGTRGILLSFVSSWSCSRLASLASRFECTIDRVPWGYLLVESPASNRFLVDRTTLARSIQFHVFDFDSVHDKVRSIRFRSEVRSTVEALPALVELSEGKKRPANHC